jgi:flavin-binding protein dodecin
LAVIQLTEEITVTSQTGPEEAVRQAIARATAAMLDVENVEVKRVEALLENMSVVGYRVMLEVTQSLDPESQVSSHGDESQMELVRQRILLEDFNQENLDKSDRFLAITRRSTEAPTRMSASITTATCSKIEEDNPRGHLAASRYLSAIPEIPPSVVSAI